MKIDSKVLEYSVAIFCLALLSSLKAHSLVGSDVREAPKDLQAIGRINDACTATLVTNKIMVTAAHCVMNAHPKDLKITFMKRTTSEAVSRITTPNFIRLTSPVGRGQDIALIELAKAVVDVQPIKLGLNIVPNIGDQLILAGYGRFQVKDSACFGPASDKLLAGTTFLKNAELNFPENNWGAELSADGTSVAVCGGDSGGPALVEVNNELYVVGVTSSGGVNQLTTLSLVSGAIKFLASGIQKIEQNESDEFPQKFNVLESDWVSPVISDLELIWKNSEKDSDTCELTISMTKNQPFDFGNSDLGTVYQRKLFSCNDTYKISATEITKVLANHGLKNHYTNYPIGTLPQFATYEDIATLTFTLKNQNNNGMLKTLQGNCTYFLNDELSLSPVRQDFGHHCTTGTLSH